MLVLYGSCLCGGVKYAIAGPLFRPLHCHCSMCRKAQGAALRSRAGVKISDFEWLQGNELMTYYESPPGFRRGFFRVCGSPDHQWVARSPRARRWPGTGNARHRSGIAPAAACLCCRQGAMVRDHRRSAATPERAARGIARFDHWIRLLNIGLERGKSELSYCLHYFPKLGERRGRVCEATWREDLSR